METGYTRAGYPVATGVGSVTPQAREVAMGITGERAFEVVILARTFSDSRGRAWIEELFPLSVLALYDAVTARPDWSVTADLTTRALLVADTLDERPDIAAQYQADVDAGRMGFGAGEDDEIETAIGNVRRAREPTAAPPPPPDVAVVVAVEEDIDYGSPTTSAPGGSGSGRWWPRWPWPRRPRPPATTAPPPPPATGGEPAPTAPPEGDVVHTWLNAEIDDGGEPLVVGSAYDLSVFFGAKSETAAAAAPASVMIPRGEQWVDVSVELASSDFTVSPFPQQLRVRRDGTSLVPAIFRISPLHGGPSTLTIFVDVAGNFLQRLEMTFDVGTARRPLLENFGRPAGAVTVLEPRAASMQISPDVGGYKIRVNGVTEGEEVFIPLTPDQLAARIESVRDVLLATVKDREVALNLDIPSALGEKALAALAFEGYRLYQAIFDGPSASAELRSVGRWLRETLREDVTTLQVVSTGFPVPWALVYLADRFDPAALDWSNFIGMRHVVEQVPLHTIDAVPPASTIASTPDLSVRVLYNDGIDEQMPSHPVAAQRSYWGSRAVALSEGTRADDLLKTALAPEAADKLLYLYCHAVASDKDPDDSYLVLSGDEKVTLGQLSVFAPIADALSSNPLVFINACESGDLSPNFYDGFVPYFLAKGARGVIGTECKTPGLFASEWAKAFFDRFFAGEPLGEVVLGLRRQFLADHGNPLGLLYGIHCDVDTRVDPALVSPTG